MIVDNLLYIQKQVSRVPNCSRNVFSFLPVQLLWLRKFHRLQEKLLFYRAGEASGKVDQDQNINFVFDCIEKFN